MRCINFDRSRIGISQLFAQFSVFLCVCIGRGILNAPADEYLSTIRAIASNFISHTMNIKISYSTESLAL